MSDRIPRLSAEEMPPALAAFLRPRIKRLGYLGEFFQCTAHQPEALLSFLEFTEHLKHALPNNLIEVVALSIAALMENDYELIQHERLSRTLGFSEAWIREVVDFTADSQFILSEQEKVVQRLVMAVVQSGGRNAAPEFVKVTQAIGPAKSIAVLMLIGRYLSHALIVNTLNLAPPEIPLAEEK
jgi:alkylhydroperoxidase family enzyme